MFGIGMQEMVIIGIVAILLFGSKLPDVARSLGHSYREFKRGLGDIQSSLNVTDTYTSKSSRSSRSSSSSTSRSRSDDIDDHDEAMAPKFEPPTSEPTPGGSAS
jgi:sec-independent protein translocase protein TatA